MADGLGGKGVSGTVSLELNKDEIDVLRSALDGYISDLREEIAKTERHEWREALHHQRDVLREIQGRLS